MWFTDGSETHPHTPGRGGLRGRALMPAMRRAARCRRGGAQSVEFSMIAIGLITLMLACVETAWQGMTAVALENGVLVGSREGSLGRLMPDGTRSGQACDSDIMAAIRRGGGGFLNDSSLALDVDNFGGARNAGSNTGGVAGAGFGGRTAVYTVTYQQPSLIAGKFVGFVGLDRQTHRAVVTVRNEPFSNGASNAQPCP